MSGDDDILDLVLGKLENVRQRAGYWTARCPAHDDNRASLSVARGTEQPVVLKCHAGCDQRAIIDALGLSAADISKPQDDRHQKGEWTPHGEAIAIYDYVDENSDPLFQVCRTAKKDFSQRVRDASKKSGFRWSLGSTRRVPYRLPKVIAAAGEGRIIYIVEGEKDVHAIERAGGVATCNPMGAGKWRAEYNEYFRGAEVVIVADKDDTGRKHAADVAAHLRAVAKAVRIVEAAEGKDAADHLAAGFGLDAFRPAGLSAADADSPGTADSDPVAARLAEVRAALLDSDGLDSIPEPEPVIDGLLYRDSIAWLYGKPGTYKSIIAIDWASCVSLGLPWQEREVTAGPVLYLYAEGRPGLRQRVRAWEDRAGCKTRVLFEPLALQIMQPVDGAVIRALVAEMQPVLVIIDTQARATVGIEENSTTEMGRLVQAVTAIIAICRSCLLLLHHEPRGGENLRGAIALEGAATSIFRAGREGRQITLENRRQRDAPEADDMVLYAVPRLHSVVVESNAAVGLAGFGHDPTDSERRILAVLSDCFLDSETSATTLMEMTRQTKSTFYYAINALVGSGQVVRVGTRGRYRYGLAAGRVQSSPTQSSPTISGESRVQPPTRGLDSLDSSRRPDQWPRGSEGEAAG